MEHDDIIPLSAAECGEVCRVAHMAVGGALRRRLLDLGMTEGTHIEKVSCGPFGDPSAYSFRGAVIALRGTDASEIFVRKPIRV